MDIAHVVAMLAVVAFPFYFRAWLIQRIKNHEAMRRIRSNIRRQQKLWYS